MVTLTDEQYESVKQALQFTAYETGRCVMYSRKLKAENKPDKLPSWAVNTNELIYETTLKAIDALKEES